MRHPALRIASIIWALLWFGLVVPGHQRGQISLPGMEVSGASCCEGKVGASGASQDTDHCDLTTANSQTPGKRPIDPKRDPVRRCAVCYVTARLSTPSVVELHLGTAQLLEVISPADPVTVEAQAALITYLTRGPPLV